MMTGIIKMNGEERNAVKYKIKGDVLDGVGENPEKDTPRKARHIHLTIVLQLTRWEYG